MQARVLPYTAATFGFGCAQTQALLRCSWSGLTRWNCRAQPLGTAEASRAPFRSLAAAYAYKRSNEARTRPPAKQKPDAVELVSQDVRDYWAFEVGRVNVEKAKELLPKVDVSLPLGFTREEAESKPYLPMRDFCLEQKKRNPKFVLLVKVGEFYETMGLDAVMLVQWANLNPMGGPASRGPRAGCPLANLRATLRDLTNNGLSVAICEEVASPYSYGGKPGKKQRFHAGVVTPASPNYVHGLVEDGAESLTNDDIKPVLGVARFKRGFTLMEVNVAELTCTETHGLSEDAVTARLHRGGLVPPLYLHDTLQGEQSSTAESSPDALWQRRMRSLFNREVGDVTRYQTINKTQDAAVRGMLDLVKRDQGLEPDTKFEIKAGSQRSGRPHALGESTMLQLGMGDLRGVPNLLAAVLPEDASTLQRRWMRQLLLQPPEPSVALAIQNCCRLLKEGTVPLPKMVMMPTDGISQKLRAHETSHEFWDTLRELLANVAQLLASPAHAELSQSLLVATSAKAAVALNIQDLVRVCSGAVKSIERVVAPASSKAKPWHMSAKDHLESQVVFPDKHVGSLSWYFGQQEDFHGKVLPQHVDAELQEVDAARKAVLRATASAFSQIHEEVGSNAAELQPDLHIDMVNQAVWLKCKAKGMAAQAAKRLDFIHPSDRHGNGPKNLSDIFSTTEMEQSLDRYRRANAAASDAVLAQLRSLAGQLQPFTLDLCAASTLSIILQALISHVQKHHASSWTLPELHEAPQCTSAQSAPVSNGHATDAAHSSTSQATALPLAETSEHDSRRLSNGHASTSYDAESAAENASLLTGRAEFEVTDVWPYWLSPSDRARPTVVNSFSMDSIFLLTGPNMAGKSTVLRSVAAVALCALCGLMAPARHARVPQFDRIELHTFVGDSPLEHMSGFAVETSEMRNVVGNATNRSLCLIDEFGKGTEANAGAAIAAALLEELDARCASGIFATHLHPLLALPDMRTPHMRHKHMEIDPVQDGRGFDLAASNGRRSGPEAKGPTWRMLDGHSTESLALEVAHANGISPSIIERSRHFIAALQQPVAGPAAPSHYSTNNGSSAMYSPNGAAVASNGHAGPTELPNADTLRQQHWQQQQELAQQLLVDVAHSVIAEIAGASVAEGVHLQHVAHNEIPPIAVRGCSCAYLLKRSDGFLYPGETDNLSGRLKTHKKKTADKLIRIDACYVCIPRACEGKSSAKEIETQIINVLKAKGMPLHSDHDGRKRHARTRTVSQ